MNKIDYNKIMLQEAGGAHGEKLLLHSCCGPCSSRCLETLKEYFSLTVYYYNPNITQREEYDKRKSEQLRLLRETGWADFLECDYEPREFFAAARGLESEPEGGARCYECYRLRLKNTACAGCTTISKSRTGTFVLYSLPTNTGCTAKNTADASFRIGRKGAARAKRKGRKGALFTGFFGRHHGDALSYT